MAGGPDDDHPNPLPVPWPPQPPPEPALHRACESCGGATDRELMRTLESRRDIGSWAWICGSCNHMLQVRGGVAVAGTVTTHREGIRGE